MKRITILLLLVYLNVICDGSDREKRHLRFPPQSIMQLAFAVATPAQVPSRMISTNMGVMFNVDLPTNLTVWYPWRPNYRRRRSADSDQAFYGLLQTVLSMNNFDGRACLQKSICQMREEPITGNDIPHQLLNLFFGSGQRHTDAIWEPRHHNTSCDLAFPSCQFTPVDLFMELITSTWSPSQ
ncbi:uncharacterized protein LOC124366135 isoform X2 [Homalodisca vitripennis]|uniref:uncharacterized protein LOC124366135 isoform X2 n=1 Tax=Homalodisca vitripennis TaxID=197043 RepID=UPI001EEBBCEA|nr:uncharacterized protein LOC124366135 isoform X2 [Homalodisca vitripennis]